MLTCRQSSTQLGEAASLQSYPLFPMSKGVVLNYPPSQYIPHRYQNTQRIHLLWLTLLA